MPYVEYDEVEAACPECGSLFRSTETLEAHRQEVHGGSASAPERPRPVRCAVCGRTVRSVAALELHNRRAHVAGGSGARR